MMTLYKPLHLEFCSRLTQYLKRLSLYLNMVNAQTMRAFLRNHYKAGNYDTADALIDAGLDDYEIFQEFSNKDMHNLCAVVRKPGGQILVNNVSQSNPGVNVPPLCEMRLKFGAYAAKYYALVGRPINAQSMSWVR